MGDLERTLRIGSSIGIWTSQLIASAIAAALLSQSVAAADDVHIWIRAFVPDAVAGFKEFSEPVTASPGQFFLRATDGGCIATDHRSWSDVPGASSRLSSDFHLVIDGQSAPVVRASGTQTTSAAAVRTIDCASGAELAATPAPLLADGMSTPAQSEKGARLTLLAAIADPLRPWSSATIHYDASFIYDARTHTLAYQASTALFPAYEAYASLNEGPVVTVFRSGPFRSVESGGATAKLDARSIEVKGSVILNEPGQRPKAPANFTVQ